jgi:hypothetical protein
MKSVSPALVLPAPGGVFFCFYSHPIFRVGFIEAQDYILNQEDIGKLSESYRQ